MLGAGQPARWAVSPGLHHHYRQTPLSRGAAAFPLLALLPQIVALSAQEQEVLLQAESSPVWSPTLSQLRYALAMLLHRAGHRCHRPDHRNFAQQQSDSHGGKQVVMQELNW